GSAMGGAGFINFDASSGNVTLNSSATSSIIIGDQAQGGMTLQNGASITHGGTIMGGNAQAGSGTLAVQGDKSSLTSMGDTSIGQAGQGTANILSSGTFNENGNLVLGSLN